MSRLHSNLPLIACTPDPKVRSQLALSWGVETVEGGTERSAHRRHVPQRGRRPCSRSGGAEPGDYVVIVAGTPANTPGSTNTLRGAPDRLARRTTMTVARLRHHDDAMTASR